MLKSQYITNYLLFCVSLMFFSCGGRTEVVDAKSGNKRLKEINEAILGKDKKHIYEGANGYSTLLNDFQNLHNSVLKISPPKAKGGPEKRERKDLETLKTQINDLLANVNKEKEIYEVLEKESTKPLQKIENFIAFNKYASKSIKRKKIDEIKSKIAKTDLPVIEKALKDIIDASISRIENCRFVMTE